MSTHITSAKSIVSQLATITNTSEVNIIEQLVPLLYENTLCVGGQSENITYKELPNIYSNRNDFTAAEKKLKCTGKLRCRIRKKINKIVYDDIKLLWDFLYYDKKTKEVCFDCLSKKSYPKLLSNKAMNFMKNFESMRNDVFCDGSMRVRLIESDNTMHEHLGSNHCLISLPHESEIIFIDPTLNEFVCALYLIKTKKFNNQYETYSGCKISKSKFNDRVDVDVSFNYDDVDDENEIDNDDNNDNDGKLQSNILVIC